MWGSAAFIYTYSAKYKVQPNPSIIIYFDRSVSTQSKIKSGLPIFVTSKSNVKNPRDRLLRKPLPHHYNHNP
jgi:hypothetical protein